MMTNGQVAQLACVLEVLAPKAGNVHPGASFADATCRDFLVSAVAIAPVLDDAASAGVGATVLRCVEATRAVTGSNTNLGIVLLLAPLCAVPRGAEIKVGVQSVLAAMAAADGAAVYQAIRMARPGGLGAVARGDVHEPPTAPLLEAMRMAADRDAVARQYVTGFAQVIDTIAPDLVAGVSRGASIEESIVHAHLAQMAREPDSLIRRKCGDEVARESQARAQAVLDAGWPNSPQGQQMFDDLDRWLRGDGNRRNPGTSADLIAAGLYVALRNGRLRPPFNPRSG